MDNLPTFDQLTATAAEDPVEILQIVGTDRCSPRYPLEFYMGSERAHQFDFEVPHNSLKVRASLKKFLVPVHKAKWTILPIKETTERLLKFVEGNRLKKEWDWHKRKLYTEEFPIQEYEYEFIPLGFENEIGLLSSNGERKVFQPPFTGLPRFKSTIHPLFVLDHNTCLWLARVGSDIPSIIDEFQEFWIRVPSTFAHPGYPRKSVYAQHSNCKASWKPSLVWGQDSKTDEWVRRHVIDEEAGNGGAVRHDKKGSRHSRVVLSRGGPA